MNMVGTKAWVVVLAIWLGMVSHASAQEWLQLRPLEGEVRLDFDGFWRTTGDNSQQDLEIEERVRLRQRGSILDPKIASFSLMVEPTFSQGKFQSDTQADETRDAQFLNYTGSLSLLHGTTSPVDFAANGGRQEGDTDGSLGSRSETDTMFWDTTLNWKNEYLPVRLQYKERYFEEKFRSTTGATLNDRDEVLRTAGLFARSSKTTLNLQREWFDDRRNTLATDSDYRTNRGSLAHRFEWGKASQLDSRVDYLERAGFNPIAFVTIDERARIQHTDALRSTLSYGYENRWEPQDIQMHEGDYGLTHRLYRNLVTSINVGAAAREGDFGQENQYNGGLRFNYNKKIPWEGRLTSNLGGSYRITDRDTDEGALSVVDEQHFVTTTTTTILLDQRFIDAATIVITSDPAAAPNPPFRTYTEGPDYTVVPVANNQTQIVLPGGSQIITDALNNPPGITVLVSYDHAILPTIKFSTTTYNIGAQLNFGWISIFHQTSGAEQNRISGAREDFLTDRRQHRTGVNVNWTRRDVTARLGSEYVFSDSGDFETQTLGFSQSVGYTPLPTTSWNFTSSQTFTESNGSNTDLYAADLFLNWQPLRNLSVRPHLGGWFRRDEGSNFGGKREENFLTAGLDLRWTWRKVVFDMQYDHNHRGGESRTETEEDRVQMSITRKF